MLTALSECTICRKLCVSHGLKTHMWRKHSNEGLNFKPNRTGTCWNKGLHLSNACRSKLSKSRKGKSTWNSMSPDKKDVMRNKARMNILHRYSSGWQPRAGRCKKYNYRDFSVDGKWELEFCKWADSNSVAYSRNYDRFGYIDENGISRMYTPDFKLMSGEYVEIKGFQTRRDSKKWEQFPKTLIILKRSQIDSIRQNNFQPEDLVLYRYCLVV